MVRNFVFLILFIFVFAWEGDSCLTPGSNIDEQVTAGSNWATATLDNKVYCVWYRTGSYIFMRGWSQIGPWSRRETVSIANNLSVPYNYYPSIASDSNNNIHIVWRGCIGNYWGIFYRAKLVNGNWTNICSLPKCGSTATPLYPKIAGGKGDTAHIVFYTNWGGRNRIGYAKIYPSYPNPTIVDIDTISPMNWTFNSSYPHVAVDGQNRIHIVWEAACTLGNSNQNIFYRMRKSDGIWTAIETVSIFINSFQNNFPRVAIDGNGNIHIVWQARLPNYIPHIGHRVKTISGWSEVTILPGEYLRTFPTCTVDPFNNLHIVTASNEVDTNSTNIIRFVRRPSGDWEGPEYVTNFFDGGARRYPEIVATPDNNLHLFRNDYASYTGNICWIYYKRHISTPDIKKEFVSPMIISFNFSKEEIKIFYFLSKKEKAQVTIYNIIGDLIYSKEDNKGYFAINIKNFPKGIYFIKFTYKDFQKVKKLIIY